MGSKTATKLVLLLGLLVLLATSAAFIFIGSYIIHLSGNINDLYRSTYVLVPTIILLTIGIVLVLLVLIGFVGCILEKKTLLGIFFALLCVIFLCEVTALTLGLVYKFKIKETVNSKLRYILKYYSKDVSLKKEIDYIQSHLECCGVQNYTDWTNLNQSIPDSCCKNMKCKPVFELPSLTTFPPDANKPYPVGCSAKVERMIITKFVYIILILISIILLQVVSLVASCCIFRNKRSSDYEPFNNGYHV